jgi:hypothetical protein
LLMAVLDLCPSQWQWAAVAMRARVVMAVPVRNGLLILECSIDGC